MVEFWEVILKSIGFPCCSRKLFSQDSSGAYILNIACQFISP
jgi:uncharacterized cysteine cluster protein YcgN (CxxCxxCC family)